MSKFYDLIRYTTFPPTDNIIIATFNYSCDKESFAFCIDEITNNLPVRGYLAQKKETFHSLLNHLFIVFDSALLSSVNSIVILFDNGLNIQLNNLNPDKQAASAIIYFGEFELFLAQQTLTYKLKHLSSNLAVAAIWSVPLVVLYKIISSPK